MDLLNIDFKKTLPLIIDAFTEIYGQEYHSIISEKLNSAVMILYQDYESLDDYVLFLKKYKSREYSIKFLEKIGINVEKYKKDSYIEYLDIEVDEILSCFIVSSNLLFEQFEEKIDFLLPIYCFDSNNNHSYKRLLKNKLKLINYFRDNKMKITEENFELFSKTEEYLKILEKVKECKKIYEELQKEYNNWRKTLFLYEKYIEEEKNRKNKILQKKKDELFLEIFDKLPTTIRKKISTETFEEQQNKIFGSNDISSQLLIESFSEKNMNKLMSEELDINDIFWIVYKQDIFLKKIGISIPDREILDCDSEEDVAKYLNFLNQDDVKKYLPSDDIVSYITMVREEKYEEALKEYYMSRKYFKDIIEIFGDTKHNNEYIYSLIKNRKICIFGIQYNEYQFTSAMLFSVRDCGSLAHSYIHESAHIIDNCFAGTGFELRESFEDDYQKNAYDNSYRKYEKFNETLTDIFSIEVNELLQKKGIYLFECKEFTLKDISSKNTSEIVKNLLKPLLEKFRKQVIKAKINSNPNELIKYIGVQNFEELVDAVNKVDYLARKGVKYKIETNENDYMVMEYNEQLERVKQIYKNIDVYCSRKFDSDPYWNYGVR